MGDQSVTVLYFGIRVGLAIDEQSIENNYFKLSALSLVYPVQYFSVGKLLLQSRNVLLWQVFSRSCTFVYNLELKDPYIFENKLGSFFEVFCISLVNKHSFFQLSAKFMLILLENFFETTNFHLKRVQHSHSLGRILHQLLLHLLFKQPILDHILVPRPRAANFIDEPEQHLRRVPSSSQSSQRQQSRILPTTNSPLFYVFSDGSFR